MMDAPPTPSEDLSPEEEMRSFTIWGERTNWLFAHFQDLKEQYPDQFIAVIEPARFEVAKTLDELKMRLKRKGVETVSVPIEYLPSHDLAMVI